MAKKHEPERPAKTGTKVISFRIATDLHATLEEHAGSLRDETGVPLNASGLARRLVIAAIPALDTHKGSSVKK